MLSPANHHGQNEPSPFVASETEEPPASTSEVRRVLQTLREQRALIIAFCGAAGLGFLVEHSMEDVEEVIRFALTEVSIVLFRSAGLTATELHSACEAFREALPMWTKDKKYALPGVAFLGYGGACSAAPLMRGDFVEAGVSLISTAACYVLAKLLERADPVVHQQRTAEKQIRNQDRMDERLARYMEECRRRRESSK